MTFQGALLWSASVSLLGKGVGDAPDSLIYLNHASDKLIKLMTLRNMSDWVEKERFFRLAGIFTQNVPLVSSGRAEVEDEVPIGLPRSPELELPNAALHCEERF